MGGSDGLERSGKTVRVYWNVFGNGNLIAPVFVDVLLIEPNEAR